MSMNELDRKINRLFPGLVVRKDLVKTVKGNAIVPTYVLEYLLGQYCATSDEDSIQSGIETVKEILRKHYVHRNEAGLIRSVIKEQGRHKVIDKISVALNDKTDSYEATFANLGIRRVLVDSDTIKKHPRLLVSGVWCIADLEYQFFEDKNACPWILTSIKPIQLSQFDFDGYIEARQQFSTDEWIDLLIQSIGFNPEQFDRRGKLLQLVRLIPYCERNYNLIELGPKGTGKSHIYSEFSPHGILISGGEVTVPKLFVNNSTGKIGLVGYWDTVAFDEFAGKKKRVDKALVDIMKNYMANKSFSRGVETLGAEASMVFVGNTRHTLPYMLKHTGLFDELPEKYLDSAFLDRLHFYIPGWEIDIIRGEMFSEGYGFVVDYLAEILRTFRNYDFTNKYTQHFRLLSDISTRDRDGINKTFSGMMKILYPHDHAERGEIEDILRFAIEGRKRVKDQLMRIDSTYAQVRFGYMDNDYRGIPVTTREQDQYPRHYKVPEGEESAVPETVSLPECPEHEEKSGIPANEIPGARTSVQELIKKGESRTLEFKSTLQWDVKENRSNKELQKDVIKAIAAFLNTDGGTLVIGVTNDREIYGLEKDLALTKDKSLDGFELKLSDLIINYMSTEILLHIKIRFESVNGADVCIVDTSPLQTEPVFIDIGKGPQLFMRPANSSRALDPQETVKYVQKRWPKK
jgi:ATP-dependent Lon protease